MLSWRTGCCVEPGSGCRPPPSSPSPAPTCWASWDDEPDRRGFAYGSLPGHAVRGEEMFAVRFDPADGGVYAEVAAFSQPATWWSRLGSPVLALAQTVVTRRYLNAV